MRTTAAERFVVVAALAGTLVAATPPDPLARARQLYNMGQYDAAITAAREAGRRPGLADAAIIIVARAELERFRTGQSDTALAAAQDALMAVGGSKLSSRDRVDLLVAWGEWSFLAGQPGVAAEMFRTALGTDLPGMLSFDGRDRVLDWWAQSLDRVAREGPAATRGDQYRRIFTRMEFETRLRPDSAAAPYWLAAATRGAGDLDGAWHAAQAGWIRSRSVAGGGATLRRDLDRLVTEAIIPERARQVAPGDARQAAADMLAQWEECKTTWTPR